LLEAEPKTGLVSDLQVGGRACPKLNPCRMTLKVGSILRTTNIEPGVSDAALDTTALLVVPLPYTK